MSIGVDLITALMKAARIVEIVDTDQTRHENSPQKTPAAGRSGGGRLAQLPSNVSSRPDPANERQCE